MNCYCVLYTATVPSLRACLREGLLIKNCSSFGFCPNVGEGEVILTKSKRRAFFFLRRPSLTESVGGNLATSPPYYWCPQYGAGQLYHPTTKSLQKHENKIWNMKYTSATSPPYYWRPNMAAKYIIPTSLPALQWDGFSIKIALS